MMKENGYREKIASYARSAMDRFGEARREEVVVTVPYLKHENSFSEARREEVVLMVNESISDEIRGASREELETMRGDLDKEPFITSAEAHELFMCDAEDEGVALVDTKAIVGTVSGAFKNWGDEYQSRKGQVVDVAESLISGSDGDVERVFHMNSPTGGVKLRKISGPSGDLFFCIDGTHRTASAKLVNLGEMPARVENATNPESVSTSDKYVKREWEDRIKRGLIKGRIEKDEYAEGHDSYSLIIESQVLPWMVLSRHGMKKMTRVYLEKYPGSLDDLTTLDGEKIPPEALVDEIAMNFFIAGEWDEYTRRQEEKKLREARANAKSVV
ncbi:hypothetical protein HN358_01265 [Candidatus Uhrbacteria bacterium]|nr:hypothetical protein [Candidatus Uhrbacteria bacterium]MBT7717339.1 hypothetical protein [Candidatus Uhrbacteria bacterium]